MTMLEITNLHVNVGGTNERTNSAMDQILTDKKTQKAPFIAFGVLALLLTGCAQASETRLDCKQQLRADYVRWQELMNESEPYLQKMANLSTEELKEFESLTSEMEKINERNKANNLKCGDSTGWAKDGKQPHTDGDKTN